MKLTRRTVLAAALATPMALKAQQFSGTYKPGAVAIGEGIWLVRGEDEAIGFANGGAIANAVILASDAGTIVVDPGPSYSFGLVLSELANQVSGAPVSHVFLTHLHPDHAFAAGAFAGAEFRALPGTRMGIERDGEGYSDSMYRLLAGWMTGSELVLPRGDLAEGPLEIGGRKLEVLALSGHSEADLAILDHATGTLIAGDVVFHNRAPATPNADFAAWNASLDRIESMDLAQLVPGHGPLDSEGEGIRQTRDWINWLERSLREAVTNGLDMTEAGEIAIPERFAGMHAARYELQRSVSHFYPRYEAELFPLLNE
ncbi:quinoprotein relay system zinc metallohydrolase 1 [Altererythrobacter sp.]|uniref:quinoprotein relay system zinc metallohydrolase 1 n=1 Tax=Altererythrobacter sp. TaxID=1872480 RepID=UPI003D033C7F